MKLPFILAAFFLILGLVTHTSCKKQKRKKGKTDMTMEVKSSAFSQGDTIPTDHTEDGKDVSPALSWSGAPEGTKSFALVCDDPDAPSPEPWVHWVIYNIPAEKNSFAEGVAKEKKLDSGVCQGKNGWDTIGYRGPAPPAGKAHRYFFKVYALDKKTDFEPGLTKKELMKKIKGNILAQGELMGKYGR